MLLTVEKASHDIFYNNVDRRLIVLNLFVTYVKVLLALFLFSGYLLVGNLVKKDWYLIYFCMFFMNFLFCDQKLGGGAF